MPSRPYNYQTYTYNSHCVYYNSGTDNVCLIYGYGRKVKLGGSGGGAAAASAGAASASAVDEAARWVNVTVSSKLLTVNNTKDILSETDVQRGKGHLETGKIKVVKTSVKSLSPNIRVGMVSVDVKKLLSEVLIKAEHLTGSLPNDGRKK